MGCRRYVLIQAEIQSRARLPTGQRHRRHGRLCMVVGRDELEFLRTRDPTVTRAKKLPAASNASTGTPLTSTDWMTEKESPAETWPVIKIWLPIS